MAALQLAVTKSVSPANKINTTDRDIVVVSDKWIVEPADGGDGSVVMVNGWTYYTDAEVAELATALSAGDATVYT